MADRLQSIHPRDRLIVVVFGAVAPAPFFALAFSASGFGMLYAMLFMAQLTANSTLAPAATVTQGMVLSRMRGTATAVFFVGATLLGLSLGPYLAGRMSTMTGSLSTGLLSVRVVVLVGMVAAVCACVLGPDATASCFARDEAGGEPIVR